MARPIKLTFDRKVGLWALAVTIVAIPAGIFGPPMFERWLDRADGVTSPVRVPLDPSAGDEPRRNAGPPVEGDLDSGRTTRQWLELRENQARQASKDDLASPLDAPPDEVNQLRRQAIDKMRGGSDQSQVYEIDLIQIDHLAPNTRELRFSSPVLNSLPVPIDIALAQSAQEFGVPGQAPRGCSITHIRDEAGKGWVPVVQIQPGQTANLELWVQCERALPVADAEKPVAGGAPVKRMLRVYSLAR